MKANITRNLRIGFGLSLLLLIISSIASYTSIQKLLRSYGWVTHTHIVIQRLGDVISYLKDAETGQRGYLITNDTSYLQPYIGAAGQVMSSLDTVKLLIADHPLEKERYEELRSLAAKRLSRLRRLIDKQQAREIINPNDLNDGKEYMDSARVIIKEMQDTEEDLLDQRTATMRGLAMLTPGFIVLAAILALAITVFYYIRVNRDIKERIRLQQVLEDKDRDITWRIGVVQQIADKISEGNYHIRVEEKEKDELGNLAVSLNKMAASLEQSFHLLEDNEWLQTGIAQLNENMVGEKDIRVLADHIIQQIAQYTRSQVGALYLAEEDQRLMLQGSYALSRQDEREHIGMGEGVVGQCAVSKKEILLNDIPPQQLYLSFASGSAKLNSVIAFPVLHEHDVLGVVELGTLHTYTERDLEFMRSVAENIGIAIKSAQNHARLQELLEETQAQTEELQVQHNELEGLNAEMEAQTEKLQASEEELKVQQEELLQTNQELEERSRLLEEKNHLIAMRNLDIQKKAEELALSTKYKSEFLANMSHELRTPLNAILLLSRLLTENNSKNLTTDQIEYARVIQTSGNGLLQLIDEILDLSKIESGKMQPEYAHITIEDIASDMRMLFAPMAEAKKVELRIIIDESAPRAFETDKTKLEQVLKNLLANAIKFTAKGYVRLKIFQPQADSSMICFSVKDTGIGIPPEKQKMVFEAFQQADGSTKRQYGGTGLGLSISLQLTRLLRGSITLTSEVDKGSEFIVTIPQFKTEASTQQAATEYITADSNSRQNLPKLKTQHFTTSKIPGSIPDDRTGIREGDKVILIVEDDTVFAQVLLDYTRKQGYKGIVAVRGDEGIEMAKTYRPLGILLDIQLPVKSGWEVMDELKQDTATRHIPVHIISSFEVKRESLQKGAIAASNKPVDADQLNEVFRKIEYALNNDAKKALIMEDDPKHAKALAYFLASSNIRSEISHTTEEGMAALYKKEVDCVILNMDVADWKTYQMLDNVKESKGLENTPVIIFTGKNLSKAEEARLKQYADSIIIKTAHSYRRILDEVSIFLHVVDQQKAAIVPGARLGALDDVLQYKTVLIADDDVRNIFSLTKALENYKMKVLPALDGKEVLKLLEGNPVDIILLDIMMPEMDGYEVLKQIRKTPELKNIPVIAVTAKAMKGDREKCIQAGASDYISKPVDLDQLISLLRVWLYEKATQFKDDDHGIRYDKR